MTQTAKRHAWNTWTVATLAAGCAGWLLFRLLRRWPRTSVDAYEEWWRERDRLRSADAVAARDPNTGLFV